MGGSGCTTNSCSGMTPICDSTMKMCRGCTTGECGGADAGTSVCASTGACVECATDSDCKVGTKPICDLTTNTCRGCTSGTNECASVSAATPACSSSGACVQCVGNTDCATATKPICDTTNVCRACGSDAECGGPGVCMTDGHCATAGEVIFVRFNASGCPSADGSAGMPYCAPNDAVAALTATRHVIIVVGATAAGMTLNTMNKTPVVVGRKDTSGNVGSILAGPTTAIAVMSDTVLIRDLTVNAGTISTSKGVVATGTGTRVTLLRVSANLATGLGIDAEVGTTLTMDECYVTGNSSGGILINGASYDIQNTVIAANGYGLQFSASAVTAGSQFWFNTVVGNSGSPVSCDPANPQTLSDSIVVGTNVSCNIVNSVTTMPTLTPTTYHLTAHQPCPTAPGTFPDHDIDGDPRTTPVDCGADQFVP